jgi:hypothetical protein
MTINDYSTLIIAITTVVYTFGTFLLWKTTRDSAKLAHQQAKINERRLKANLYSNIVNTHRDFFFNILSNSDFYSIITDGMTTNKENVYKEFIGTWLINHASQIYIHHQEGNFDNELWLGVVEDMKDMFKWSIVADRWDQVKNYHTYSFRLFVENQILTETITFNKFRSNEK